MRGIIRVCQIKVAYYRVQEVYTKKSARQSFQNQFIFDFWLFPNYEKTDSFEAAMVSNRGFYLLSEYWCKKIVNKNKINLHIYGFHLLNPYKTVASHLKHYFSCRVGRQVSSEFTHSVRNSSVYHVITSYYSQLKENWPLFIANISLLIDYLLSFYQLS